MNLQGYHKGNGVLLLQTCKGDLYYSDAIIAHEAGQTLAGLFLLRTFIEQTARTLVPNPEDYGTGDELMRAYGKTLHEHVKKSFPSLAELYSELSADIHTATGSSKLFEDAVRRINKHFKAKALYDRID